MVGLLEGWPYLASTCKFSSSGLASKGDGHTYRLKVKSQCDWGLGRQYLSLGEDLAKSFKKHMCLVRPLVRLFHHT